MNVIYEERLQTLFGQWKVEDRRIEEEFDDVRHWMSDVSQLGIPRFGETALRLKSLRRQLAKHFQRENEITNQLSGLYSPECVAVSATRRQAIRDHRVLLDRLNDLVDRLDELEPPFESWQSAINEVESFVAALEQHEDHEAENVAMLIPHRAH